jgi:hypothetical protein
MLFKTNIGNAGMITTLQRQQHANRPQFLVAVKSNYHPLSNE